MKHNPPTPIKAKTKQYEKKVCKNTIEFALFLPTTAGHGAYNYMWLIYLVYISIFSNIIKDKGFRNVQD